MIQALISMTLFFSDMADMTPLTGDMAFETSSSLPMTSQVVWIRGSDSKTVREQQSYESTRTSSKIVPKFVLANANGCFL